MPKLRKKQLKEISINDSVCLYETPNATKVLHRHDNDRILPKKKGTIPEKRVWVMLH